MPYTGDRIVRDCYACDGTGKVLDKKGKKIWCSACNGTGGQVTTYYSDGWLNG